MSEAAADGRVENAVGAPTVASTRVRAIVGAAAAGVAFAAIVDATRGLLIGTWILERYVSDRSSSPTFEFVLLAMLLSSVAFRGRAQSPRVALGAAAFGYLVLQWMESSPWLSLAIAVVAIAMGRRNSPRRDVPAATEKTGAAELAELDRRTHARAGYHFSTLLYRVPLGLLAAMAVPVVYCYTAGFEATWASIFAVLGVGVALGGSLPIPELLLRSGGARLITVLLLGAIAYFVLDASMRAATFASFRESIPFAHADPRLAELALCATLLLPFAMLGGFIGAIWRTFSPAEVEADRVDGMFSFWFCLLFVGSLHSPFQRDSWVPIEPRMTSRHLQTPPYRIERRLDATSYEVDGSLFVAANPVTIRNRVPAWLTPASSRTIEALWAVVGTREDWTDLPRGVRWRGELRMVEGSNSGLGPRSWESSGEILNPDSPEWGNAPDHDLCRVMLPSTLAWEDLDHTWARWLGTRANVGGVQAMRFLDLAATPPNRVVESLVPDAASVSVMLVFAGAYGPFLLVTDAEPKPALREEGAWLPLLTQREFAAHEWPEEARPYRRNWNPIASHATLDALIALLEHDPAQSERLAAAQLLKALSIHRDHDAGNGDVLDLPYRHVFTAAESDALVAAIEKAPKSHLVARQCAWLLDLALETTSFLEMRRVLDALRRHHPDDLEVERVAARYFTKAGDPVAALASWNRIVEAAPKDVAAAIERARALFDTGAIEEARAVAESVRPKRATRTVTKYANGSVKRGIRFLSQHPGAYGLLLLHMARDEAEERDAYGYLRDAVESPSSASRDVRAAYERLHAKFGAAAK